MPMKMPTILTMIDMKAICFAASPETYGQGGVISDLRPPFTEKLADREFAFTFDDGTTLDCQFMGNQLQWRENGGDWHDEQAECLESTVSGVFLINHLRRHVNPYEAATLILDTRTKLVTWVRKKLGNKNANRDVNHSIVCGTAGNATTRHAATDEMVGRVIDWKFADGVIIHTIYETVECCAMVSPPPLAAPDWRDFFTTFNPAKYMKIADDLYLISFYAPGQSGMEVTMLMDLARMRATGAVFGLDSTDTLRSYTFGAKGANASLGFIGRYTIE